MKADRGLTQGWIAVAAAAALLSGCGGTLSTGDAATDTATDTAADSPGDPTVDTSTDPTVDTSPDPIADTPADTTADPGTDAPPPDCDQHIGTFEPGAEGFGWMDPPDSPAFWMVEGTISDDWSADPLSYVSIEGWSGDYAGPWAAGTYSVTAWESYETCGLCIWLYESCPSGPTPCAHTYMADRATLDLSAFDPVIGGTVTGTLTGAYLVETNQDGTSLVTDGLSYCIDLWVFSGTFEDWNG